MADDFDTLTLRTAHTASSYGVPVLLLRGQPTGRPTCRRRA